MARPFVPSLGRVAMRVIAAAAVLSACSEKVSNGTYTISITKVETVQSVPGKITASDASKTLLLVHLETDDPSLRDEAPQRCGAVSAPGTGESARASALVMIDGRPACVFTVDRGGTKFTSVLISGYPPAALPDY